MVFGKRMRKRIRREGGKYKRERKRRKDLN
jgi:hypothetical protein